MSRPILAGIVCVLVFMTMLQSAAIVASAQSQTSFSFNLLAAPFLTKNPTTGNFLRATGDGSFVVQGTCPGGCTGRYTGAPVVFTNGLAISGGGSWQLLAPDRKTVLDKGTWVATGFVRFTFWGGDNPGGGLLGGRLDLTITLTSGSTGAPITGGSNVATTIVCRAGNPPLPRSTTEGGLQIFIDGTTLPEGFFIVSMEFTQRISPSSTVFHLND